MPNPGSPAIARDALRAGDRAIFVELHPDDGALLARRFNRGRSKVLHLDGWTALHGLVPPPERRGLVLIDPPYEDRDELVRLAGEVTRALRKWPTGIFGLWYPIKATGPVDRMAAALAEGLPANALRLDLLVDDPDVPDRLNGCGLIVVNPPWTLQAEAEVLLPALAERLARADYGAYRCETLTGQAA